MLRSILIVILVAAASGAMFVWWFDTPEAVGSSLRTEVVQMQVEVDPGPPAILDASVAQREEGTSQMNAEPPEDVQKSADKPKPQDKAVNCQKVKCVALTFDDGPGPFTGKLLKTLKKEAVPATFFLVGRNVEVYPEIVAEMTKQGHEIGNHTWSHQDMRRLSKKKVTKELADTSRAIMKVTGSAPTLVRPPYGAINKSVRKILKGRGESAILWDVDTEDWKNRSTKKTTKAAIRGAENGSIILLHDIHSSTVDAVPGIIKKLRKDGFTFVTVSELLGDTPAGEVHFRR